MNARRELITSMLRPGDVLHVRGTSLFPSRAIRRCLGGKVWGNHDALVIEYNGRIRIGETAPWFSRLIEVEEYNKEIRAGKIEVRVYRMHNLTPEQGRAAGDWWIENVQGRPYDFMAYPRLIAKCIVGDLFHGEAGWRWANWCTEGVVKSLNHAVGGRIMETKNPTPLHMEKAVTAGVFVDITEQATQEAL